MRTTSRASRVRRLLGAATAALIALGSVFGTASAATAAPSVTYPDAISNIQLARESGGDGTLHQWELARITADWAVPDGARAGETFGMTLPAEFSRYGAGAFDIVDPDTQQLMATCQVSQGGGPEVVCTLTAAVEGREGVGGSFWMSVQASQATTSQSVQFDVGGQIVIVALPGGGGIVPEDLTAPTSPYKYGEPTVQDGRMLWTIGIPSTSFSGGAFTVADQLDPSKENHHYTGDIQLVKRGVANGQLTDDWSLVAPSQYSVDFSADMKSFRFEAHGLGDGDALYILQYATQADGVTLDGDVFGNNAVVGSNQVSSTYTTQSAGGGSGSGVQHGRFTLTKAVTGDQQALAQDATYTLRYAVKGAPETAKTMTVTVGQPVRSDRAPLGSTFVIEEIDLPEIAGVQWGPWTLTGDGVVALGDGTYEVTPGSTTDVALTLTNRADLVPVVRGSIAWTKVDPDGAALSGSQWTLTGPDGVVRVVDGGENDADPADGALRVADLPLGTYTLSETVAPEGYQRTDETFTIVLDDTHQDAAVGAIENAPVSVTPTPTPTPTPVAPVGPGTAGIGGTLAVTGGTAPLLLGWVGLTLAGLGIATVLVRRRVAESHPRR